MIDLVTSDPPGQLPVNAGFAERLLEVIDSGRRTATYKLALLIALLDLCARHSDTGGRAPRLLYTRDIAEQVAALYWPQVIPYLVPGVGQRGGCCGRSPCPGRPSSRRSAAFRRSRSSRDNLMAPGPPCGCPGPIRRCWIRSRSPSREQPLPRLQAVGSSDSRLPVPLRTQLGTAGILLPGAAAPPRPPGRRRPAAARRRR